MPLLCYRKIRMKTAAKIVESSKTPRRVTVAFGNVEAFVERSQERARKLDRGEGLAPEITMTFEDPADLLRVLSGVRAARRPSPASAPPGSG
jgi:hypothetical protein